MRVVQLINDYNAHSGGAQKLVQELHQGLLKLNFDSTLVSILVSEPTLPESKNLGVVKIYSFKAFKAVYQYLKSQREMDVLHVHLFPAIFYVAICKMLRIVKVPVYFTEHSTSNRRRGTFIGKLIDGFIYRRVDKVIAISQGTKAELLKWQPYLRSKISVIYNGIVLQKAKPNYSGNSEMPTIISIGRLVEAKNYSFLLKVLSKLKDLSFKALILGDGPFMEVLKKQSNDLGLEDKVKFVGFQANVKDWLSKADVFVLCSKWEGFGLSALEAMNNGLPAILSDVPGLQELGEATEGVCLIEHNEDKWVKELTELLTNASKRNRMSSLAFEQSLAFSVENMVLNYSKVYNAN